MSRSVLECGSPLPLLPRRPVFTNRAMSVHVKRLKQKAFLPKLESMKANWNGVFPAVTTQLKRDQSLDLEATARHLEVLIRSGVNGLIMLGSLGENQSLAPAEKRRVIEMAVRVIGGRVPVLSGVAENSTAAAVEYLRDCEKIGVDGFMLMPAMVYKGDTRETIAHFRSVAAVTGLPIMIYNNPVAYANDITPEMFAELADVENFVALKESSGNTRRIPDLHNIEHFGRERFGNADAAVRREAPADIAAVDRDAVSREAQSVRHRRIVVGDRAMILELGQDRELAGRGRQPVGAVEDHRGADLVAGTEHAHQLGVEVDADPHRALRHSGEHERSVRIGSGQGFPTGYDCIGHGQAAAGFYPADNTAGSAKRREDECGRVGNRCADSISAAAPIE